MEPETLTWIFLIGGVLLMLMEFLIPSGVALFLGFSGMAIGILRFFGILIDPTSAIAGWLILSVALTIAIRPFIKKYFKADSFFKFADEDYEAMDQVVDVTVQVTDQDNSGRIRFDGITWKAKSLEGRIKAGEKAKIRYRENTTWIVESMGVKEPAGINQKNKTKT